VKQEVPLLARELSYSIWYGYSTDCLVIEGLIGFSFNNNNTA